MCIQIIKDKCLKLASDIESKVFFNKLIGDYYRYLAETAQGEKLENLRPLALEGYQVAESFIKDIHPCNVTRLSLCLNLTVFY